MGALKQELSIVEATNNDLSEKLAAEERQATMLTELLQSEREESQARFEQLQVELEKVAGQEALREAADSARIKDAQHKIQDLQASLNVWDTRALISLIEAC